MLFTLLLALPQIAVAQAGSLQPDNPLPDGGTSSLTPDFNFNFDDTDHVNDIFGSDHGKVPIKGCEKSGTVVGDIIDLQGACTFVNGVKQQVGDCGGCTLTPKGCTSTPFKVLCLKKDKKDNVVIKGPTTFGDDMDEIGDGTQTNNINGADASSGAPCFERETATACRALGGVASKAGYVAAYATCFGSGRTPLSSPAAAGERVLMSELRAGDVVLTGEASAARVVVNQHVRSAGTSVVLEIETGAGSLALTPDHVVFADGAYVPASRIKVGSTLGPLGEHRVERVSARRGHVINPLTSSGTILAAGLHGAPALAATGNAWLANVLLSAYPQYTLSFGLARLFPASVQAYYDLALEPFFNAAVPALEPLKAAAPAPLLGAALLVGDGLLAAGLALHMATTHAAVLLAGAALALARMKA